MHIIATNAKSSAEVFDALIGCDCVSQNIACRNNNGPIEMLVYAEAALLRDYIAALEKAGLID